MTKTPLVSQPGQGADGYRPGRRSLGAAVLLLMAWALPGVAQVAVEHQPDPTAWYHTALEMRAAGRPNQKTLLAMKPSPIPASLQADLRKYDWLDAGGYSYPDKQMGVYDSDPSPSQLDFLRYLADGGELRFSYNEKAGEHEKGQIYHLNFIVPLPTKVSVRKVSGDTYLQMVAYGTPEVHRVISYHKGVLVYDISFDGKPRSRQVKFRVVRIAIPRSFEWALPAK